MRSLDGDAETEAENRIYGGYFYGERKTHKQVASFHPSCSTVSGNMPYFLELLPSYCFGIPRRRAPFPKPNTYSLRVQKPILQFYTLSKTLVHCSGSSLFRALKGF